MADDDRYEWISSGGCQCCDNMEDRFYEISPPRPHPNCNCTIYDRSQGNSQCDSSDVRYDISHAGNSHHSGGNPAPDDEFDMYFDYVITCWGNSQTISGQVSVSVSYGHASETDVEDLFDEAFAEAIELVDDIAVNECPVCGKHPLVA